MMVEPATFLPFVVAFAIVYAAESAWRLWRKKAGRYLSVPGELLSAVMMILVTFLAIPTHGVAGMAEKGVAGAGFAMAAVLRLMARQRFATR